MNDFPHRKFPCDECPIRADNAGNPKSMFPAERWQALSASVHNEVTGSPGMNEILFGCHKGEPGTDADLACAGWLAQFGVDHVAVRFAIVQGRLSPEALHSGENWPPLHPTWDAVVKAQTREEDL